MELNKQSRFADGCSKAPKKIRLMPFGDSITEGFTYDGAYRKSLADRLEENGLSQYVEFVGAKRAGGGYNNAHSGFTSFSITGFAPGDAVIPEGRGGISELADGIMDECSPDVIMLQIGTNDILSLYDLDNAGKRLESLVDKLFSKLGDNGTLFLATIPYMDARNNTYINPDYFTSEFMDKCIDEYNDKVRDLVRKKQADGKNIRLAEVNSVLSKEDLQDGVHPTEDGYSKLGNFWYKIISDYITE